MDHSLEQFFDPAPFPIDDNPPLEEEHCEEGQPPSSPNRRSGTNQVYTTTTMSRQNNQRCGSDLIKCEHVSCKRKMHVRVDVSQKQPVAVIHCPGTCHNDLELKKEAARADAAETRAVKEAARADDAETRADAADARADAAAEEANDLRMQVRNYRRDNGEEVTPSPPRVSQNVPYEDESSRDGSTTAP